MFIRLKPDPYSCYVASFGIAMAVYVLGWSELYPPLQTALIVFLVSTFALHLLCSWRLRKRSEVSPQLPDPDFTAPAYITAFIYIMWLLEFAYDGGIPLFKILLNSPYDYRFFGIPTLHVIVVTFSSFYTVYLFNVYLVKRRRLYLLLYVVNLAAALLIYNRGMLFFNLFASLVVYLNYHGGLTKQKLIIGLVAVLALLYVFGVLGSLRMSRLANQPYNNENFLETGRATESFRNSVIPKEFFWTYIYVSSPLANLQQNVRLQQPDPPTLENFAKLVNGEIFPDFLSKRIVKLLDLKKQTDSRIPGPFNASTIYSRSYSYAGWPGLFAIAGFLIVFPFILLRIVPPQSRFFLTGWAILCTMYFFSVFENTFRFTGLSFQLAYPILLHWVVTRWNRLSRVF